MATAPSSQPEFRHRQLLATGALATLIAARVAAQQIANGGFETGDLSGWAVELTQSGLNSVLAVETIDIDGLGPLGPSPAAALNAGAATGTFSLEGIELSQMLTFAPGSAYELSLNWSSRRAGSIFAIMVDGEMVALAQGDAPGGPLPSNGVLRATVRPAQPGPHRLGVRVLGYHGPAPGSQGAQHIDNIVLAPASLGACCFIEGACAELTRDACSARGGAFNLGAPCGGCSPSMPPIYANCNLETGATTLRGHSAPANSRWSECALDIVDPHAANTSAGFSASRLADDLAIPAGGWFIQYLKVPVYQTGADSVTMSAATLRIFDGPPSDPASGVVFGDLATNRLAAVELGNTFRIFNTAASPICAGFLTDPGFLRRIQWAYIRVEHPLAAGRYWLEWGLTGSPALTGPWHPASTVATAIGRQCDPLNSNALRQAAGAWQPVFDSGQGCAPVPVSQDLEFELLGSPLCYPDCDGSSAAPVLNVADFTCFLQRFAAGASYANCDQSTTPPVLNVADFTCFLQRFAAGCP